MGLSDLFSKVKELSEDETVKSAVKKVSGNKKVQEMCFKNHFLYFRRFLLKFYFYETYMGFVLPYQLND